jgi:preprotein translocase subunit YajC
MPLPLLPASARWLAVCAALSLPFLAAAATFVIGPERQPATFAETLDKAQDGDEIVLLSGTYKGVTAVIEQKKLTIRGQGKTRPVILFDSKLASGRALFIVKGGDVRLENLEFRGARAADGDGAGVLFEKGRLEVVRCAFFGNEHGLVTGNVREAELTVLESEFAHAPREVGGLNHLLYVGAIASFTLTGSRLHNGFEGHLLKTRARENHILYNMIRDGSEGQASYEVDFPSGGRATLIGNVIGQSPRSQNPVLISYGAEGKLWEENSLVLSHNTLISEGWRPAWFLRVHRDRVAGMGEVLALNNLIVGSGIFELGASGRFAGNRPATLGMLADVVTGAFELPPDSIWRGRVPDPRKEFGRDLAPQAEFEWPAGVRAIPRDRARWAPGAYQR